MLFRCTTERRLLGTLLLARVLPLVRNHCIYVLQGGRNSVSRILACLPYGGHHHIIRRSLDLCLLMFILLNVDVYIRRWANTRRRTSFTHSRRQVTRTGDVVTATPFRLLGGIFFGAISGTGTHFDSA